MIIPFFIYSKLNFIVIYFEISVLVLGVVFWKFRFLCLIIKNYILNLFKTNKYAPDFQLSTDVNNAVIETCFSENIEKYLTYVNHPAFNDGSLIIIGEYENETEAKTGHEYWIQKFKQGLPNKLKDVIDRKIYKRVFVDHKEDDDDDYELYFD